MFAAMPILLLTVGLCVFGIFLVEADVHIEFEDLVITHIDPKYFDTEKTEFYSVEDEETGESAITTTLAIIKKLPPETTIRFVVMGLSMGQYNVPTGLDITMDVCDAADEPIMLGRFFLTMGFTRDTCPPEPGIYSSEGFRIPAEGLPDEFPENKYLANVKITLKNKPIIAVDVYVNVQSN